MFARDADLLQHLVLCAHFHFKEALNLQWFVSIFLVEHKHGSIEIKKYSFNVYKYICVGEDLVTILAQDIH